MDMESLRIFLDVRQCGSMTAAAEKHYMTQPALGKRIAQLEKELGVKLFLRGKGQTHVQLTQAGESFCDIAERMLMLYGQALELRENSVRQYLTVACIRSAHDSLMPKTLVRLKKEHPELCVTVEDHHTSEIMPLLENKRIDIGITQNAAVSPNLTSQLLYEESYCVVMRPDCALNGHAAISPSELNAEHGIFQAFDQPFEEWFHQHWQPYSVKMRVNTTPTAERYFSDADDWMIVPEAAAHAMEQDGFLVRPLSGSLPIHRVYLTYRKHPQKESVLWFIQALTE